MEKLWLKPLAHVSPHQRSFHLSSWLEEQQNWRLRRGLGCAHSRAGACEGCRERGRLPGSSVL